MSHRAIFASIALVGLAVTSTSWAAATAVESVAGSIATAESAQTEPSSSFGGYVYPMVLAAGAVAGVVTVNTLTYGVGTLPTWIGIPTTAPFIAPASAAASRIFVITSGVLGAWVADAIYTSNQ